MSVNKCLTKLYLYYSKVLAVFPVVPLSQLFDLMHTHLEPTASDKSAEERGVYFGRVFALLALVRSGCLREKVSCLL